MNIPARNYEGSVFDLHCCRCGPKGISEMFQGGTSIYGSYQELDELEYI